MSSEWWPQTYYSTPSRALPPGQNGSSAAGGSTSHRTRFAGDQLDPDDERMADGIKFLPSFASSPAGKFALGNSPANSTSPTAARSPRGAGGVVESSSPRNTRSRPSTSHQPILLDEDAPPTTSLRDISDSHRSSSSMALTASSPPPPSSLPTPPSLLATPQTTSLHVFGPPPEQLHNLRAYLEQFGQVVAYKSGPSGSNWWTVEYASPTSASWALRRHGDIVSGRWMIGFKIGGAGSLAGCTLVDGHTPPSAVGAGEMGMGSGAGTPIRPQSAAGALRKPKVQVKPGEEIPWDEGDVQQGWTGWIAERMFGR
ncbi:hypothetical protein BCR39DRAFT_513394 [Naematelia encephala]|uniref:RRM Nup35-type domain-containing protein n=1 Tax=Naematelia encephala TaxID=71784 RepID=A0A1Y2BIE2_9TREE|nr:hypothetical protein BCR39DRAFT_513394 [Naematelia encephala]